MSNELLGRLLPGPVTLVFKRRDSLNPLLNPNKLTVGTRVPDSPFITRLAQHFDGPIGLTSANLSAEKSTLRVEVRYKDNIIAYNYEDDFIHRNSNVFGLSLI